VSLGFFDDIHIPRSMLPQPAVWKSAEREWAWRVEDGDQELFFGRNAEIRFRVDSVDYPPLPSLQAQAEDRAAGNPVLGTAERPHVPMAIVGRADATGLGMTAWGWE